MRNIKMHSLNVHCKNAVNKIELNVMRMYCDWTNTLMNIIYFMAFVFKVNIKLNPFGYFVCKSMSVPQLM